MPPSRLAVLGSRALAAILGALLLGAAPPSRLDRLARLLELEDRRAAGGAELERLLRDPDRRVRRRAALTAGRLGDPAAVPALVELLNDGEPEVRQMSAFALGLIGDRSAVDRLLFSLADTESAVRARAAEALGRIGDGRAAGHIAGMIVQAIPKGAALLTIRGDDPGSPADPWLELRLALFALARLKEVPAAESALLASGRPRFDWWAAAWTAMRIESPALRPALLAAARSSDPLSRALAARGLGALKDAGSADLLGRLAADPDETVAIHALRALAAVGDPRGAAAAASQLASRSAAVQAEALKALAALPVGREHRARIVPFAGHELPFVRSAAFAALARLDRDELALVLSGLDPDPAWSARAGLAEALGSAADEVSLGILFAMLRDEDVRVLPHVLTALRRARGADAVDTLRRHLEHPDVAVRAAAADNLAALPARGLSEALAAAYRSSLDDLDLDARLAQVAALVAQKDGASRAALREIAAKDPARAVRARAGAGLREAGEEPPPPGEEAVRRPSLDYREAMAPYDPPPGQPLYTPRAIVHTRHGRIEIHLNILEAPLTCGAFLDLARSGFYDGLTFHRVVPGFVVQGGCPRGDGNGGPGYTLRCEIGQKPFGRGGVGMAHSGRDTGGSQFFITLTPQPHLDGGYTLFGTVASGMDVVERIRPGDVIERVEVWDGR
jgi:cyclophilin family peptidyl-prolyl cis-trans isomerase/HEAT repeat protein